MNTPDNNSPQSPTQEPQRERSGHRPNHKPDSNGNGHFSKGVPGSAAALGLDLKSASGR